MSRFSIQSDQSSAEKPAPGKKVPFKKGKDISKPSPLPIPAKKRDPLVEKKKQNS